ncbi:hypothetical protein AB1Y20_018306 [Prymnesium parvum]|uniref:Negatively light-regulated protein n=1 Tax=Prymnesium parvum TaxID=97485 RepID=A0AB34JQ94_PRYPA
MADGNEEQATAAIMKDQEEQLRRKYPAGLPVKKGLLGGDRKYFDSADWAKDRAAKDKAAKVSAEASKDEPVTFKKQGTQDDELLPPPPISNAK